MTLLWLIKIQEIAKFMSEITTYSDGPLGWITISAPEKLNSMSEKMWQQLPEAVAQLEKDPAIRVLILRGDGTKAFSAGADISEFDKVRHGAAARAYNEANSAAFRAIMACSKPTISMIEGHCLGGGLLLALASDLRFAAEGARFALPPARLGLGFNLDWTALTLKTLPAPFAKEMLFTGARFSAEALLAQGALNRVFADDELLDKTRSIALDIAGNAPLSLLAFKRAIDDLAALTMLEDRAPHDRATRACFESEDYKEGRLAFQEKRKPNFKGR